MTKQQSHWWQLTNQSWLTDLAVWVILLMPLIVYTGIYQPFSFGRYAFFMLILVGLALGVLVVRVWQLNYAWWRQPIFWLTLVWLAVAIIAAFSGVNLIRSWWGTVSRGMGMVFFVGLWLMGWWLLLAVNQKERWLKIFAVMSWVGAISGFYAILQTLKIPGLYIIASGARAAALMGNPIFLGQLLLFTIFLTLYFVISATPRQRWGYIVSLLLQIIGIVLTASRGPLLTLAIAGLIWGVGIWWLYRSKLRLSWRGLWGGLAALVAVAVAVIYLLPASSLARIFDIYNTSMQARLVTWRTAWLAIQDRPLLGFGNENAWYAFTHFYQPGLADLSFGETIVDRAHNFFLDQLLANGWIGLLAAGLVFGFIIWGLWRYFRKQADQGNFTSALLGWSLLITTMAYLLANMTGFDTVATTIYGAILLTGIIALLAPELVPVGQIQSIWWWRTIIGILLISLIFIDGKYLVPAMRIGRYVKTANSAYEKSDYKAAAKAFAKAQETINPYRWSFLTNYPSFARKYAILSLEDNPAWADSIATDGLRVVNNIKRQEPDRVAVFMEYPILYTALSFLDPRYAPKAEESFNELVKEFPNHEYIYLNWARSLMGMSKYPEARKVLNQLEERFKLVPRSFTFWRALTDIRLTSSNRQHIVNDLQTTLDRKMPFADGDQDILRLATSYLVSVKQWQLAVQYQEKIVKLSPQDVAERLNLAVIYKELKDYSKAREQALIIIKLDPSKLEATKQFLQSMGQTL
ncbi:MAG: O-antigen ligase family protein [Patescibacteria group bacterium]|jgi:O-antigen ligase/tetratricopeptide (TPR) repeat protein